jgi:YVTN family beta-propeller protein
MNRYACLLVITVLGGASAAPPNSLKPGKQPDGSYLVVTGQFVKPWGRQTEITGRPVDLALNAADGLAAILNTPNVELRRIGDGQLTASFPSKGASYAGIAFRPQAREIWASEAASKGLDSIVICRFDENGKSAGVRRLELSGNPLPIGLGFSPDGRRAYVVLSRLNLVRVFDTDTLQARTDIPAGIAPFALTVSPDGNRLFVTNRGHQPQAGAVTAYSAGTALGTDPESGAVLDGSLSVIDLKTGNRRDVACGQAPAGIALRPDGQMAAVANAYSGTVSLFNLRGGEFSPVKIPIAPQYQFGILPVACDFSPDGKRLYVALGGLNAIAVLEQTKDTYTLAGLIPAGFFPSALQALRDGSLEVVNIKGEGSTADPAGGHRARAFHGSFQTIAAGFEQHLSEGTTEVTRYNKTPVQSPGLNWGDFGVKHVLLLIKENRTYDQVFGDLPQGNGDPRYLMYGRDITPNHHALAEKFVLLDNFYATGAISFDGHQWLEQGFVGDHVERALTNSPRGYAWDLSDALDVSPAGFFWQQMRHPLNVRVGGILSLPAEFQPATQITHDIDENDLHPWRFYWDAFQHHAWEGLVGSRAAVPALARFMDRRYPVNSMKITDQIRASVIQQEFAEAERTGNLPELMAYGMTSDHTMGTDPNAPTPNAMLADNDLALGRIVDVVSHSRFWSSTLILAVEDDSQNGVDHVDGHHTVALAIGPMVKRGAVDSHFYTQLSMIRTIQGLLGIEPSTRFQQNAQAMESIFTHSLDLGTFNAIIPKVALDAMNPPMSALSGKQRWGARKSSLMNWNHVDDIPTAVLNRILWWDHAGYDSGYPVRR